MILKCKVISTEFNRPRYQKVCLHEDTIIVSQLQSEVDRGANQLFGVGFLAFVVEDGTFEVKICAGFGEPLGMPDEITADVSNVLVEGSLITLAIGKKAIANQNGTLSERPAAFDQAQGHGLRLRL